MPKKAIAGSAIIFALILSGYAKKNKLKKNTTLLEFEIQVPATSASAVFTNSNWKYVTTENECSHGNQRACRILLDPLDTIYNPNVGYFTPGPNISITAYPYFNLRYYVVDLSGEAGPYQDVITNTSLF